MISEILSQFFLSNLIYSVLSLVFLLIFLVSLVLYLVRGRSSFVKVLKKFIWGAVILRIVLALVQTMGQYFVWSQNEFTRTLLHSSLDKSFFGPFFGPFFFLFNHDRGYFMYYSLGHFFFNAFLSILCPFLFYVFLNALRRYNPRFFEEGDRELGLLIGLCMGWPNFIIYIPAIFIVTIPIALLRLLILKQSYTTLGLPFIAAGFLVVLWGSQLIQLLHLEILII